MSFERVDLKSRCSAAVSKVRPMEFRKRLGGRQRAQSIGNGASIYCIVSNGTFERMTTECVPTQEQQKRVPCGRTCSVTV